MHTCTHTPSDSVILRVALFEVLALSRELSTLADGAVTAATLAFPRVPTAANKEISVNTQTHTS